jgi:hypothetical protein
MEEVQQRIPSDEGAAADGRPAAAQPAGGKSVDVKMKNMIETNLTGFLSGAPSLASGYDRHHFGENPSQQSHQALPAAVPVTVSSAPALSAAPPASLAPPVVLPAPVLAPAFQAQAPPPVQPNLFASFPTPLNVQDIVFDPLVSPMPHQGVNVPVLSPNSSPFSSKPSLSAASQTLSMLMDLEVKDETKKEDSKQKRLVRNMYFRCCLAFPYAWTLY